MSAIAEPFRTPPLTTVWRAATRWCWRCAQALAGGNNTVIVSPPASSAPCSRPTKGSPRCRSPSWCSACGSARCRSAWLARRYGRRFALQTGSVFGMLSGLISYSAVMHGSFCAAAARHLLRRPLRRRASVLPLRRRRYRERALPRQGGVLGAGRRRLRRRDRAAARHLHQGSAGRRICSRQLSRPVGLRAARGASCCNSCTCRSSRRSAPTSAAARRNRAPAALHRRGRLRHGQLRHDEHGDDLGAARHGRLRPFGHRRRRSASSGMCWRCMRRASSPAR